MTTRSIFSRTLWRYGRRRQPRLSIRSSGKKKWERYESIMIVYDFIFLYRMKTKIKICIICSKIFTPFSSLNKTCTLKCENKRIEQREKEKRKKVREKKKNSISTLWKIADRLWSLCIRMIGYCEYCWKKEYLNAHHIYWRNNKSVRWEIYNGICLCSGCHTFSSVFSAHKTPTEFTYWLEHYKWKEYMDTLRKLAHEPMKVTPEYLQETIDYLKRRLEE